MNLFKIINPNLQNNRFFQGALLKRGLIFSPKINFSTKIEENLVYQKENFYLTQSFAIIGISSVIPVYIPKVEYISLFGLAWATVVRLPKLNQSYISLTRSVMTKFITITLNNNYY